MKIRHWHVYYCVKTEEPYLYAHTTVLCKYSDIKIKVLKKARKQLGHYIYANDLEIITAKY